MEHAQITCNGKLIAQESWKSHIQHIQQAVAPATQQQLQDALIEAVKKRIPNKRFGIFFSGGVDSTFIAFVCKQLKADFVCYTVGLEGSEDLAAAERAAELLGLKHKKKVLKLQDMDALFKKVAEIVPHPDVLSLGVGSVVVATVERAAHDNITHFFTGLGSEEIFAGYQRHAESSDINQACWDGLTSMYERDFLRDYALAQSKGIALLTPFLDPQVIQCAMGIPAEEKINADYKKIILRKIAESMGMPKEFAWRKKRAAQYGSKTDKALEKCAKINGFKYKKDYIAHLCKGN